MAWQDWVLPAHIRELREDEKDRENAIIRQLVSSGKLAPEEGLKLTIMKNGRYGQLEKEPNPVEAPYFTGGAMTEDDPTPQMRIKPLTLTAPKEEKPLYERDENGNFVPVQVPGLKDKDQIIPEQRAEKEPKETPDIAVAKDGMKKFNDDLRLGLEISDEYRKQADVWARTLGYFKVPSRGKAIMEGLFKKKPTGKYEEGPTSYKPASQISEAEWPRVAEAELEDAMEAAGYSDEEIVKAMKNKEYIQKTIKQMKAKRGK